MCTPRATPAAEDCTPASQRSSGRPPQTAAERRRVNKKLHQRLNRSRVLVRSLWKENCALKKEVRSLKDPGTYFVSGLRHKGTTHQYPAKIRRLVGRLRWEGIGLRGVQRLVGDILVILTGEDYANLPVPSRTTIQRWDLVCGFVTIQAFYAWMVEQKKTAVVVASDTSANIGGQRYDVHKLVGYHQGSMFNVTTSMAVLGGGTAAHLSEHLKYTVQVARDHDLEPMERVLVDHCATAVKGVTDAKLKPLQCCTHKIGRSLEAAERAASELALHSDAPSASDSSKTPSGLMTELVRLLDVRNGADSSGMVVRNAVVGLEGVIPKSFHFQRVQGSKYSSKVENCFRFLQWRTVLLSVKDVCSPAVRRLLERFEEEDMQVYLLCCYMLWLVYSTTLYSINEGNPTYADAWDTLQLLQKQLSSLTNPETGAREVLMMLSDEDVLAPRGEADHHMQLKGGVAARRAALQIWVSLPEKCHNAWRVVGGTLLEVLSAYMDRDSKTVDILRRENRLHLYPPTTDTVEAQHGMSSFLLQRLSPNINPGRLASLAVAKSNQGWMRTVRIEQFDELWDKGWQALRTATGERVRPEVAAGIR